jgi:ABC-type Zn uptake system ZnuABC Zn-binding protein ZnuA
MKSVLSLLIRVSILVVPVIQLINSSHALKSSSMAVPNTSAVTHKFNVVTSVAPIANIINIVVG